MEQPKNLHARPMDMNKGRGDCLRELGVLEGEEKEQEIRNLFEKIIKENFPNLVRDLQPKYLFPARISFRLKDQIKNFPDKKKTKGIHHHQTIII